MFTSNLYRDLQDPKKLANALSAVIPAEIARALVAYSEMGLTGNVTLHFRNGAIVGCSQSQEHQLHSHKVQGAA